MPGAALRTTFCKIPRTSLPLICAHREKMILETERMLIPDGSMSLLVCALLKDSPLTALNTSPVLCGITLMLPIPAHAPIELASVIWVPHQPMLTLNVIARHSSPVFFQSLPCRPPSHNTHAVKLKAGAHSQRPTKGLPGLAYTHTHTAQCTDGHNMHSNAQGQTE